MNISDFLVWLTSGGFMIVASWLLGQIPNYAALAENIRQWIFFAVSLVIGGGAYGVITYVPQATLATIAPYFAIAAIAFAAIFLQKAYNKLLAIHASLFKK